MSCVCEVCGTRCADSANSADSAESAEIALGYNPHHLGAAHPLALPADATPGRVLTVIEHPHLTILFSAARRLAACCAFNYDGSSEDTRVHRTEFHVDALEPAARQTGSAAYRANPWDRGHLAAFHFLRWGAHARQAGADSFAWTNIAPQHANMHTRGGSEWTRLEAHVKHICMTQACEKRISCFAGGVFGDDDFELVVDGAVAAQVPKWYWFVAAWVSEEGELRHKAFMVENYRGTRAQVFDDNPTSRFDPHESERSIGAIEKAAGLVFGGLK